MRAVLPAFRPANWPVSRVLAPALNTFEVNGRLRLGQPYAGSHSIVTGNQYES
jgi:hypothetical protein